MRPGVISMTLAVCGLFLILSACNSRPPVTESKPAQGAPVETHIQSDEPPDVVFELKPSSTTSNPSGFQVFDCTYTSGGKTARFRLFLKQVWNSRRLITPTEGKFVAVAGSDSSVLLQDLKKALDAKMLPKASSRAAELPFAAVIFGKTQNRSSPGGFFNNPSDDWMAIKVFLPKGGDDGEFFLNLNPALGKGKFSMKDPDYGDYVLRQLAKVL